MENFKLINYIQTAVAVIDENLIVVDSNDAFKQKSALKNIHIVATKCYEAAHNFSEPCKYKSYDFCPVLKSFQTKKTSSNIHYYWIDDQPFVEELITTPIIEENGNVNYVVEEFRDVTELLRLEKNIITTCSYCKKVRDNTGQWLPLEDYLQKHTGTQFSHGLCEDCNKSLIAELKYEQSGSSQTKIKSN